MLGQTAREELYLDLFNSWKIQLATSLKNLTCHFSSQERDELYKVSLMIPLGPHQNTHSSGLCVIETVGYC